VQTLGVNQGTEAKTKKVTQNAIQMSTNPPFITRFTRYQMKSDERQVNECSTGCRQYSSVLVNSGRKVLSRARKNLGKTKFCTGIYGTAVTNCTTRYMPGFCMWLPSPGMNDDFGPDQWTLSENLVTAKSQLFRKKKS